jgi:hypothetical protein
LFFVFVFLTWRVASKKSNHILLHSVAAGAAFSILVFSYFFLWTAALAWFVTFLILWISICRFEWRDVIVRLSPIFVSATLALLVYAWRIAKIAQNTANTVALEYTHSPDWKRGPLLIGIVIIGMIGFAIRKKRAHLSHPVVILVLSLVFSLFAMFNQQIITGHSLQPFHYEVFVGNYVVLLALVITIGLFRGQLLAGSSMFSQRAFFWLCVLSIVWGETEVRYNNVRHRDFSVGRDASVLIAKRLSEISHPNNDSVENREVLFSPDILFVSDNIAGNAPQALLWATHAVLMPSLNYYERQERFFRYLYYSGVNAKELSTRLLRNDFTEVCALFGYERQAPHFMKTFQSLSSSEIEAMVKRFEAFISNFDYSDASKPTLSWVVIPTYMEMDCSNLDRWYIRESEEKISAFKLYRVRLREPATQEVTKRQ